MLRILGVAKPEIMNNTSVGFHQKSKYFSIVFLAVAVTMIVSCQPNGNDPAPAATPNHIFTAGWVWSAERQKGFAMYWRDTVGFILGDTTINARTTGIAVSGGDVYVGGMVSNGAGYDAIYWKNDHTSVHLTSGAQQAQVWSMAASGTDVYAGGFEQVSSEMQPRLWKNGVLVPITGSNTNGTAVTSIAISNGKVYAALGGFGLPGRAAYWVDGTVVTLAPDVNSAVQAINVYGDDVYASGWIATPESQMQPAYWKNGVMDTTLNHWQGYLSAGALTLTPSNKLSILGSDPNGADINFFHMYWTNGESKYTEGPATGQFSGITHIGEDIYCSGDGTRYPQIWKNNLPVTLSKNPGPPATSSATTGIVAAYVAAE